MNTAHRPTSTLLPASAYAYRGVYLRRRPIVFTSLDAARRSLEIGGWTSTMWIVMGEGNEAVLVCPADAARLEKAGFEIAR
jgi:hypothetical protein